MDPETGSGVTGRGACTLGTTLEFRIMDFVTREQWRPYSWGYATIVLYYCGL